MGLTTVAMELTCLGLGKDQGKWSGPSCHLLQIAGAHILLECPLDLAMLHLFLPAADITLPNRHDVDTHDAPYSKTADTSMGPLQLHSGKRQHLAFYDEDDDQVSWFHLDGMRGPHKRLATEIDRKKKEFWFPHKSDMPAETTSASSFTHVFEGHTFLDVEPWYKTAEFSLLDVSSLNAVLISNPEGMLGLPFLTRMASFSGKIYATSVTAKLGQLMMEELVSMHAEYKQNFGRSDSGSKPIWLDLTALNGFPALLKKALVNDDGVGRANWQYLYSKKDIEVCMKQVQCLHYDEEISLYDCLGIKPCSSGSELGASNWVISGARRLSYFSASDLTSGHSMALNVASHVHSEVFLFADLKRNSLDGDDNAVTSCSLNKDRQDTTCNYLCGESHARHGASCGYPVNELPQVCQAVMEAICCGGSALVLISGMGALMEALEAMSQALQSSDSGNAPLYFISPVAEELLVYTNTIPEWLCSARQEKLYAGEALFGHVELLQQKRLHQLATLYSATTVKLWKEPCVVFALNWGLRMGPAAPLIHKWRKDTHCLLVLSQTGMDAKLALAPFQPLLMKVLQYNGGGKLGEAEVSAIVEKLKPELSLVPGTMRDDLQPLLDGGSGGNTAFYNMWDVLTIPDPDHIEADMAAEVACRVHPKQLDSGIAVSKVTMSVRQRGGKWVVDLPKSSAASLTSEEDICWGTVEVTELLKLLQEHGLCCEVRTQDNLSNTSVCEHCIVISSPSHAKVELRPDCTLIETDDPTVRKLITDAVKSFLICV